MFLKNLPLIMSALIFITAQANAIIGGENASSSDAVTKSTAYIKIDALDGQTYTCTGTLVSRNLVITAAHCLVKNPGAKVTVLFGKTFKSMNRKSTFEIEEPAIHPEFKKLNEPGNYYTRSNDIALIKLAKKVSSKLRPVSIMDESVTMNTSNPLLLAGYGVVNEIGQATAADGLNYVRVHGAFVDRMVVTDQRNGQGACGGDSGGPAYFETAKELILVGVTRGVYAGARDCRHYGEYTNVMPFKRFILEQAALLKAEPPWFEKHP